jgi:hypothetical protein
MMLAAVLLHIATVTLLTATQVNSFGNTLPWRGTVLPAFCAAVKALYCVRLAGGG